MPEVFQERLKRLASDDFTQVAEGGAPFCAARACDTYCHDPDHLGAPWRERRGPGAMEQDQDAGHGGRGHTDRLPDPVYQERFVLHTMLLLLIVEPDPHVYSVS